MQKLNTSKVFLIVILLVWGVPMAQGEDKAGDKLGEMTEERQKVREQKSEEMAAKKKEQWYTATYDLEKEILKIKPKKKGLTIDEVMKEVFKMTFTKKDTAINVEMRNKVFYVNRSQVFTKTPRNVKKVLTEITQKKYKIRILLHPE